MKELIAVFKVKVNEVKNVSQSSPGRYLLVRKISPGHCNGPFVAKRSLLVGALS